MTRVSREVAAAELRAAGMIVDSSEFTVYADGDCSHCGSRYKVGELDVATDGTVDREEAEDILALWNRRS